MSLTSGEWLPCTITDPFDRILQGTGYSLEGDGSVSHSTLYTFHDLVPPSELEYLLIKNSALCFILHDLQ